MNLPGAPCSPGAVPAAVGEPLSRMRTEPSGILFELEGGRARGASPLLGARSSWQFSSAGRGCFAGSSPALGFDPAGNVTVSAGVTVLVDNAAPAVAITSPQNGASLFLTTTGEAVLYDVQVRHP